MFSTVTFTEEKHGDSAAQRCGVESDRRRAAAAAGGVEETPQQIQDDY